MSQTKIPVATLGVPRIGRHRELKYALEAYWSGKSTADELLGVARSLRAANWKEQVERGIVKIPSNDFSLYDHVLDTAVMVGAIPARYGWTAGDVPLDTYFAMACGSQGEEAAACGHSGHGHGVTALEMTKWFDTTYHYMVPELSDDQAFSLSSTKPLDHFVEAKGLGIHTRPVILGPVTFLKLAKSHAEGFNPVSLLPKLVPVYEELLRKLAAAGADWVQIDESALVLAVIGDAMKQRRNSFAERSKQQHTRLGLPLFPTTTIGLFPQTPEVRKARAAHAKGELSYIDYEAFLKKETAAAIRWQEEIDLDVLVHGEFERNDMVQYFGEQLSGFTFTSRAWVQSYGSRYVRPPIIYGDVSRPRPMTVSWWQYAQSLTDRPVKGMLTGPVTILNWSFVRDDLPRATVCRQIALAIRDEVVDLEKAGAKMIQIDEAALREGLPLRKAEWETYLDWAVESFRLASSGVEDMTQIHTHMCYSEFNDIIDAIAAMDADVISIETSRSQMELLDAFRNYKYPSEIGPGVYDIHSPRVPDVKEMTYLMQLARKRLSERQLWVNPDCSLKTRKWDEVRPALVNMVEAARELRAVARVAPDSNTTRI